MVACFCLHRRQVDFLDPRWWEMSLLGYFSGDNYLGDVLVFPKADDFTCSLFSSCLFPCLIQFVPGSTGVTGVFTLTGLGVFLGGLGEIFLGLLFRIGLCIFILTGIDDFIGDFIGDFGAYGVLSFSSFFGVICFFSFWKK